MSANEEKSLIEQIKYYRRFSRTDSSDSEDDGMASPENDGNDVFSTDDGRRRSCSETPNIQVIVTEPRHKISNNLTSWLV